MRKLNKLMLILPVLFFMTGCSTKNIPTYTNKNWSELVKEASNSKGDKIDVIIETSESPLAPETHTWNGMEHKLWGGNTYDSGYPVEVEWPLPTKVNPSDYYHIIGYVDTYDHVSGEPVIKAKKVFPMSVIDVYGPTKKIYKINRLIESKGVTFYFGDAYIDEQALIIQCKVHNGTKFTLRSSFLITDHPVKFTSIKQLLSTPAVAGTSISPILPAASENTYLIFFKKDFDIQGKYLFYFGTRAMFDFNNPIYFNLELT